MAKRNDSYNLFLGYNMLSWDKVVEVVFSICQRSNEEVEIIGAIRNDLRYPDNYPLTVKIYNNPKAMLRFRYERLKGPLSNLGKPVLIKMRVPNGKGVCEVWRPSKDDSIKEEKIMPPKAETEKLDPQVIREAMRIAKSNIITYEDPLAKEPLKRPAERALKEVLKDRYEELDYKMRNKYIGTLINRFKPVKEKIEEEKAKEKEKKLQHEEAVAIYKEERKSAKEAVQEAKEKERQENQLLRRDDLLDDESEIEFNPEIHSEKAGHRFL